MSRQSKHIDRYVGERIRQRRTEIGLTQEQLAEALEVSYQQIQKYETGANRISAGRLFELAGTLDVEMGYFFVGLGPDNEQSATALGHGGRQRSTIEVARNFAQIEDPEIRAAITGLVKTIVVRSD